LERGKKNVGGSCTSSLKKGEFVLQRHRKKSGGKDHGPSRTGKGDLRAMGKKKQSTGDTAELKKGGHKKKKRGGKGLVIPREGDPCRRGTGRTLDPHPRRKVLSRHMPQGKGKRIRFEPKEGGNGKNREKRKRSPSTRMKGRKPFRGRKGGGKKSSFAI